MADIKPIKDDAPDALRSTGNAREVAVDRDLPPTVKQPSLGDPVHAPGPVADEEDTER